MKRKFAILAALGALAALALPASSMAGMYPASAKFEISATGKIETALGWCALGKVTGQVPPLPATPAEREPPNEKKNLMIPISAPPVGACATGTSLTLAPSTVWKLFVMSPGLVSLRQEGVEPVTLRFSSYPGCKLTGTMNLYGLWSNGYSMGTPTSTAKSSYHAHSASPLTWANDGATCALAGKKEVVSYTDETGTETKTAASHQVNNLTETNVPIYVTG